MKYKICINCEQVKSIDNFRKDHTQKDGYFKRCKECTKGHIPLKRPEKEEIILTKEEEEIAEEFKRIYFSDKTIQKNIEILSNFNYKQTEYSKQLDLIGFFVFRGYDIEILKRLFKCNIGSKTILNNLGYYGRDE